MTSRSDFPNDDDGEVLFRLALKGVDLSQKRQIDFSCYARDMEVASEILNDLITYGYEPRISIDDGAGGSGDVSVYARISMRPDYDLIVIEQERLNAILKHHDTSCDGWLTESS